MTRTTARDPFSRTYAGSVDTTSPPVFTGAYLPTVIFTLPEVAEDGSERFVTVRAAGWLQPFPEAVQ